jgi:hypothetical protein
MMRLTLTLEMYMASFPALTVCYSICVIQDDNAQPFDIHKESVPQAQAAQIALQKPSGGLARASKSVHSTPSKFSAPFSASVATPSSLKAKGKWTHKEDFTDESKAKAEVLNKLTADKHACKMVGYAQHMVELKIKKKHLDMEAKGKHLEAEYSVTGVGVTSCVYSHGYARVWVWVYGSHTHATPYPSFRVYGFSHF